MEARQRTWDFGPSVANARSIDQQLGELVLPAIPRAVIWMLITHPLVTHDAESGTRTLGRTSQREAAEWCRDHAEPAHGLTINVSSINRAIQFWTECGVVAYEQHYKRWTLSTERLLEWLYRMPDPTDLPIFQPVKPVAQCCSVLPAVAQCCSVLLGVASDQIEEDKESISSSIPLIAAAEPATTKPPEIVERPTDVSVAGFADPPEELFDERTDGPRTLAALATWRTSLGLDREGSETQWHACVGIWRYLCEQPRPKRRRLWSVFQSGHRKAFANTVGNGRLWWQAFANGPPTVHRPPPPDRRAAAPLSEEAKQRIAGFSQRLRASPVPVPTS